MAVRFDESRKVFFLTTAHSEYQMKIHECGMFVHTYYGSPVGGTDVRGNPEIPYVRLKGLDPDAVYEVKDRAIYANIPEWMPEEDEEKSGQAYSGRALMNGGYTFAPLFGVYPSAQIHFVRIG